MQLEQKEDALDYHQKRISQLQFDQATDKERVNVLEIEIEGWERLKSIADVVGTGDEDLSAISSTQLLSTVVS